MFYLQLRSSLCLPLEENIDISACMPLLFCHVANTSQSPSSEGRRLKPVIWVHSADILNFYRTKLILKHISLDVPSLKSLPLRR